MKRLMNFVVLFLFISFSCLDLSANIMNVFPSREQVQQMLMSRSWYIIKGEGTGGPALAGGTFVFTSTHRDLSFDGRPIGKQRYKVLSTRPSKSGESYFFDLEIVNSDGGKTLFEECMVKPSGSIIIRRSGGTLMGTKLKDMYLEIVGR